MDKGRVVAGWGGQWWSGKPRQGTGPHLPPAKTATKVVTWQPFCHPPLLAAHIVNPPK